MLKIPFFRQRLDYTCGPAVLQMVLAFHGVSATQEKLARICKTTKATGTSRENLVRAARIHGVYAHKHSEGSLREISWFLASGIPVVVNYREPGDEEGHYAVVVGITPSQVMLHDPYHGRGFNLSRANFMRRWHGKHVNKNRQWLAAFAPTRQQLSQVAHHR